MTTNAFELMVRVLCDNRPANLVGAAYLYCTTMDNQKSVFKTAGKMVTHQLAERILILGATPMSGYPGGRQCRRGLKETGIPASLISDVPAGDAASINTLIESRALIRYAKDQALKSLFVVAPPFHQFRAFMTAVTVALTSYPELMIYSCPGAALPWMETVAHSQGTLQAPRNEMIQEELLRIERYQNKGDLADFETVIGYLNQRDERLHDA